MGQISGYKAYSIYLTIKNIHFQNNDYDINNISYSKRYLNKWNTERKNTDGYLFQDIQKKYNDVYILKLLFATYYLNSKNFYLTDIFDDNFELFKDNIRYLRDIENNFTKDLRYIMIDNSLKNLLICDSGIPKIFKLDISWNFLVIINIIFDIKKLNKNSTFNSLERRKYDEIMIKIHKYSLIINKFIKLRNWKKIIRENVML